MLDTLYILAATSTEAVNSENLIIDVANKFGIQPRYLLAQVINFLFVAYLLYRFALKPALKVIEERQQKIADGLQYAEEMKSRLSEAEKQKAETLKQASMEATKIITEARESAKLFMDNEMQQTALKTNGMIEKAQQAIAIERDKMIAGVRREVTELVVQTTARVLDKELDDKAKSTFSESAARELAAQN